MANENTQVIILNAQEPTKPLTMITIHNSIKLTPTNYLSWKTQVEAILIGYDLQKFIDGSHPAPSPTITTNNVISINPAYQTWLCQDKLLFGALVGTLSTSLVPLITQSKTSYEVWQVLANTYARPFLGRCQWCSTQGHVVSRCPLFRQQFPHAQPPPRPSTSSQYRPPSPRQAQANVATTIPSNTTWLLDSGASHHVTTDLSNLNLHSPYDGTDEIMIGDGSGLPISHTGSTSLTTPSHSFTLSNVLCVPIMKRNLISISQFCKSNNTSIEFLPSSFHVKDLRTGAILVQGRTKDGVYEWPLSTT